MSKKILILHFPGLLNYGTAMMGINTIYYLHKWASLPREGGKPESEGNNLKCEFTCDFNPEFEISALLDEIGAAVVPNRIPPSDLSLANVALPHFCT